MQYVTLINAIFAPLSFFVTMAIVTQILWGHGSVTPNVDHMI